MQQQRALDKLSRRLRQRKCRPLAALLQHKFRPLRVQQQRALDKLSRRLRQRKFMDKFSRPLAALLQRRLCQHKFRSVRVQQQRAQHKW